MIHHFQDKAVYFLKKEITEIYIANSIRSFAMSMISIFIPIYLLKKGYSLQEAISYYLLLSIIIIISVKKFVEFASRKGVKKSIAISMPLTALLFFLMQHIDEIIRITGKTGTLIILGIIHVTASMFYFMGFHIDFAKTHEIKKAKKEVSTLNAASIILSMAGPVIGATIITISSFKTLFMTTTILLLIGIIPLFMSKEIHEPIKTESLRVIMMSKKEIKKNIPYLGEGFRNSAAGIIWPVMLYIIAINIKQIGILYTFTNLIVALITIYVGYGNVNGKKALKAGTTIHSITLIIRGFLSTLTTIATTQGIGAISFAMLRNPYLAYHYNKSKKEGVVQRIYSREIFLHLGKAINLIILITLLSFFNETTSMVVTLITGGIMTPLMNKIAEEE